MSRGEDKTLTKYREIAEQLSISVNSVNTLLARALRKLQAPMSTAKIERRVDNADQQIVRAS
jgi:DNA-binding NarL/FixJ family response regulator